MAESNPILGFSMSVLFAAAGIIGLLAPRFIQRLAQRTAANTPGKRWFPFISFVDSPYYVPALRTLAIVSVAMAALLAWTAFVNL